MFDEVWFTLSPGGDTGYEAIRCPMMMRWLPLSAGCLVTVLIILCDLDQSSKLLELSC